jgi:large subunit ribosomal protein L18
LTYVSTLKRIRVDKTNYRKRAALLIGRHSFVTIKVSDQNVATQVLKPTPTGDMVIVSAHSRELANQGWKGAFNNLPACYLTGLLLGKKAFEKGIKNIVLYIGKDHFTSRVAACLKGIIDSGINMPVSKDSFPLEERISGQHIADYANALKENTEEYNFRFSNLLKAGLNPADYPSHFEEIRSKISGKPLEKPVASIKKTNLSPEEKNVISIAKEKKTMKENKSSKNVEKKSAEKKGGKSNK